MPIPLLGQCLGRCLDFCRKAGRCDLVGLATGAWQSKAQNDGTYLRNSGTASSTIRDVQSPENRAGSGYSSISFPGQTKPPEHLTFYALHSLCSSSELDGGARWLAEQDYPARELKPPEEPFRAISGWISFFQPAAEWRGHSCQFLARCLADKLSALLRLQNVRFRLLYVQARL